MKLIVGLGNPGKKYERTRHNVGWLVLDKIVEDCGLKKNAWKESRLASAQYLKIAVNGVETELVKPLTFMNNSGSAVAYVAKKHRLQPQDIIVVHDDKDIVLGEYKIQTNRSAAGHNGVKSIIERLGTQEFTRVRVGVSPRGGVESDTADFVLGRLSKTEQETLEQIIPTILDQIDQLIASN